MSAHSSMRSVIVTGMLMFVIALGLVPAVNASSVQAAPAVAAASSAAPAPAYCVQATIDDGLVAYSYMTTVEGWNQYSYTVHGTGETGVTQCYNDDLKGYGYFQGQGCVVGGILLVVGAVMSGGATVIGVAGWAAGCIVELAR